MTRQPRRPTLADEVADAVRSGIHAGDFRPGELYSVQVVADALGVSRSPAREGLLRLSEAGLIRFERNRGFVLLVPETRDIAEIFAARLALEAPAAARAARRSERAPDIRAVFDDTVRAARVGDPEGFRHADRRLHDVILDVAGNTRVAELVAGLRASTMLIQQPTWTRSRALEEVATEHEPIVDAITTGDAAAAAAAMGAHLESTALLLMAQAAGALPGSPEIESLWHDVATR